MCNLGIIAVTTELYWGQISPAGLSLPLTLTDRPASFCVAQSLLEIHSRVLLQNKAATVTCVTPHTLLAR